MKSVWLIIFVFTAIAFGGVLPASSADVTAGADIVSAYVWRGMTVNDGTVVQPYMDVAVSGFVLNVWGNYDIEEYNDEEYEFSEIDLTLSYTLPIESVDITVGHIEYLFPNGGEGTSEIYLSAYVSPLDNFSMGIDAYYDYDEVDDYYLTVTLAYDVEFDSGLGLGASVSGGYAGGDFTESYTESPDEGFHEYTLSVSASYPVMETLRLSAFIAYTDTFDDDVLPDQDVDWFGGGGLSWSF